MLFPTSIPRLHKEGFGYDRWYLGCPILLEHRRTGFGVGVLQDGELIGGDNSYYYRGRYNVNGSAFSAVLDVRHYAGSHNNIRDFEHMQLQLESSADNDYIFCVGSDPRHPIHEIRVEMKKLETLE